MTALNAVSNWKDLLVDEEIPVSKNTFAHIPYDVLQLISTSLSSLERAEFNQTLEPQERVYKAFRKEGAEAHHMKVVQIWYNDWVRKYQVACDLNNTRMQKLLIKSFHNYIILNRLNHSIFRYKEDLAWQMMYDIFIPMQEDEGLADEETQLFVHNAMDTLVTFLDSFDHYLFPKLISRGS